MHNLNVLCGATWRGAAWGMFAGVAWGIVYGLLLGTGYTFSSPYPVPLRDLGAEIFVFSLAGMFMGPFAGLPAGALAGFLIGASASAYFSHFAITGHYYQLAGALAVLCVELWVPPVLYWLDAVQGTLSRSGIPYSPELFDIVWFIAVPTSIGCISAAALSRRVATWCINELNKGVIQNG